MPCTLFWFDMEYIIVNQWLAIFIVTL